MVKLIIQILDDVLRLDCGKALIGGMAAAA
jgi:hypothetical protein